MQEKHAHQDDPMILKNILFSGNEIGRKGHVDGKLLVEMCGEQIHQWSMPHLKDPFVYKMMKRPTFSSSNLAAWMVCHDIPTTKNDLATNTTKWSPVYPWTYLTQKKKEQKHSVSSSSKMKRRYFVKEWWKYVSLR